MPIESPQLFVLGAVMDAMADVPLLNRKQSRTYKVVSCSECGNQSVPHYPPKAEKGKKAPKPILTEICPQCYAVVRIDRSQKKFRTEKMDEPSKCVDCNAPMLWPKKHRGDPPICGNCYPARCLAHDWSWNGKPNND